MPVTLELQDGDVVHLTIKKAVYLRIRRLLDTLEVKSMPGVLRVEPVDPRTVFVKTNHEDFECLFDAETDK